MKQVFTFQYAVHSFRQGILIWEIPFRKIAHSMLCMQRLILLGTVLNASVWVVNKHSFRLAGISGLSDMPESLRRLSSHHAHDSLRFFLTRHLSLSWRMPPRAAEENMQYPQPKAVRLLLQLFAQALSWSSWGGNRNGDGFASSCGMRVSAGSAASPGGARQINNPCRPWYLPGGSAGNAASLSRSADAGSTAILRSLFLPSCYWPPGWRLFYQADSLIALQYIDHSFKELSFALCIQQLLFQLLILCSGVNGSGSDIGCTPWGKGAP